MTGPSPLQALNEHLANWAALHVSCRPADFQEVEQAVRLAYAGARLEAPRRIVFCNSPLEIAVELKRAGPSDDPGRSIKTAMFDDVRDRVGLLAEIFWSEVLVAANELGGLGASDRVESAYASFSRVSLSIQEVGHQGANRLLRGIAAAAHRLFAGLFGGTPLPPSGGFGQVAIGPHDLVSLGVYQYLYEVLRWEEPLRPMRGLWLLAPLVSWVVPYEHVCWVAAKPSRICLDTESRLHCPDGPALRFRDGETVHAWKGVAVPAWVVEQPERITPAVIDGELDASIRNAMIEIMTPERYVKSGGVERVAEDETGVLWRKHWRFLGTTIGTWMAVEVVDGTADCSGFRRHYFLRVPSRMRTPREAVAWTYGLSGEQYNALELRT